MSTLSLQNVSYTYEGTDKTVLSDVNLHFDPGKVYAIVGRSGAGKSSLLALLGGLDLPTGGWIDFNGQNLAELDRNRYRARSAGVIFQSLNLLTNATALDNIVLSMHIGGVTGIDKKARALDLLATVGISPDKANRTILKLSGGEQQRIGIARALAGDPVLLIADEPTGNLDKDSEARVLKIFQALAHDDGKCVIVVTHSRRAAAIADELWGIDKGSVRRVTEAQSARFTVAGTSRTLARGRRR